MLIDANEITPSSIIQTQVCIVGGGIAGIAMALDLEKAGIDTVVLESGGERRDEATADLYRGTSSGIPYDFADGTRSRFLGGASNCWGGFCRPWDQSAFEHRPWVNASGWPIGRSDLDPFYKPAHDVLQVPSDNYDPAAWVGMGDEEPTGPGKGQKFVATRLPVDPSKLEQIMSQFSAPLALGQAYHDDLVRAKHVRTYLHANVVDIQCNPWGGAVESVKLRTLKGVSATVQARVFILASGGIENARLLLASNRQQSAGIGNKHDLVGRYFQDHPRFLKGEVEFVEPYRYNPLFDIKFHCIAENLWIGDKRISGQLRIPFEAQKEHGLLDAQIWFRSMYPGDGTDVVRALYRMHQRVRGKWSPFVGLGTDLGHIFSHPLDSASYTYAHLSGSHSMVKRIAIEVIAEPEPDPESRVTLGDSIDALGMRRVNIDWRLSQRTRDSVDTTYELIARELEDKKLAKVRLGPRISEVGLPSDLEGTYHHMGTTRMSDSPRQGVVDRHCRVHGVENLYVTGSSVFPTSSSNNPTLTLLALALRLSDRLIHQFKTGAFDSEVTNAESEALAAADATH